MPSCRRGGTGEFRAGSTPQTVTEKCRLIDWLLSGQPPAAFPAHGQKGKAVFTAQFFFRKRNGEIPLLKKTFRRTKKYYSFAIPFLHAFTIQYGKTQHFCMLKQYQRRTILKYNVIPGVHISLREASFLEKLLLFSIGYIIPICAGSF